MIQFLSLNQKSKVWICATEDISTSTVHAHLEQLELSDLIERKYSELPFE